jgi:acetyl-CoA C-acetyltransferase
MARLEPAFAGLGRDGQDALARRFHPMLPPIVHHHTRASSPPPADGAALVLVGDDQAAARLGVAPRARVVAAARCAADPVLMLTAGEMAVGQVLARGRLAVADVDVFEVAEAFSAPTLRLVRNLGLDMARLNIYGGTLARGHAFGATGAILVLNLLEALEERQARYGVAAVSGAAGLGVALLVERLS